MHHIKIKINLSTSKYDNFADDILMMRFFFIRLSKLMIFAFNCKVKFIYENNFFQIMTNPTFGG